MSTSTNTSINPLSVIEQGKQDIVQALNALQPNSRTLRSELFTEHFPRIEAALGRCVTQTAVRKALAAAGLKLSAATFKKLLDIERQRRNSDIQNPMSGDRA